MDDFDNAFDETDVSEETVTETVADDGAGEVAEPKTVEAASEEVEQVAEEMPQETAEPTTTPPVVDDNAVEGRIQAVLAERDKRQAAEKRVAELEAQQRNFEQTQNAPHPIDPLDDPQGFQNQQAQSQLMLRIEMSEDMARIQHGDELVNAAKAWAEQKASASPVMKASLQAIGQQRNPYAEVIRQYQQQQFVEEFGSDPEAIKAKLRAEWEAEQTAPVAQAVTPATPTPAAKAVPPSLAKGGGNTGAVTTDESDDFNSVFR